MLRTLVFLFFISYRNMMVLRIIVSLLESFMQFRPPEQIRPAMNFLYDIVEPFLRLFRGLLPAIRFGGMGLDLSPIIAFLLLDVTIRAILPRILPA